MSWNKLENSHLWPFCTRIGFTLDMDLCVTSHLCAEYQTFMILCMFLWQIFAFFKTASLLGERYFRGEIVSPKSDKCYAFVVALRYEKRASLNSSCCSRVWE